MDTLFVLLKHLLTTLPFVGLLILINKVNLKAEQRARQVAMPIVALIYCIVMMFALEKFNAMLLSLIQSLTQYIPFLAQVNWTMWLMLLSNLIMLLIFFILKLILLPFLSRVWGGSKTLMEHTAGNFYAYDKDVDRWLLQGWCAQMKTFFSGIYYAAIAVSLLIYVLSRSYPHLDIFQAQIYPIFCLLVFEEVFAFLSGISKEEFYKDVFGEDESSYKVANYGMLREILSGLYGDRVLAENVLDQSDWLAAGYSSLEKLMESADSEISSVGKYFSKLDIRGEPLDVNYIHSCIRMIKGKSVLFCNPFYRDLTDYLILPIIKKMLRYQKVLVVVGRDTQAPEVRQWLEETVYAQTSTRDLWKTAILSTENNDCDIGILKSGDIYNYEIQERNTEFLKSVGMVLLIEPSRIISTGQIGLSILAEKCNGDKNDVIYCACDRNCDGLLDALSHTLNTEITEVTATVYSEANVSQMYWDADGAYLHHRILPNISHYLGVGTELSAVALRYQLPRTQWLSFEKFPVLDMKWIDGQYYTKLNRFAGLPNNQEAFGEAFQVSTNLWNCPKQENAFLIVEDEFQNLFEMGRIFSSRAHNQNFINVISENYMFRDYMIEHIDTFVADPKAIPTVVPDFARTQRNLTIRLIIMMLQKSVSETYIRKILALCGFACKNVYTDLLSLIQKNCCVNVTLNIQFKEIVDKDTAEQHTEVYYAIESTADTYVYMQLFHNAYFIAEEDGEQTRIGSKLFGQIYQTMLPGQFLTLGGKYYEVQTITSESGVILRRAADHITSRRYYRQMRAYTLHTWNADAAMAGKKVISGIEVERGFCNFDVRTDGYYEQASCNDIKNAKQVYISGIPQRNYRNKSALRLHFPQADAEVRYTICLCLNELFRTVYPDLYPYIVAVTCTPDVEEPYRYILPIFRTEEGQEDIYLFEDCEIDMGLLVSVERNLRRYLEYITEYLTWQEQKMAEPPVQPSEEEQSANTIDITKGGVAPKKKGFFKRLAEKLKNLFKRKKKKAPEEIPETEALPAEPITEEGPEASVPEENPTDDVSVQTEETEAELVQAEAEISEKISEEDSLPTENAESTEETAESVAEENAPEAEQVELSPSEEAEADETETQDAPPSNGWKSFLRFGFESDLPFYAAAKTVAYLSEYGMDVNPLSQARSGAELAAIYEQSYDPKKYGVHFCDFCGVELGGEHEVLRDGRERCNRCSETALRTDEDFRKLLKLVERNMQSFFGISINKTISIRMTDAQTIAKHCGMEFVATPGYDGRVLGFAQKGKDGCALFIENGSPRIAAAATIAHELTHIWQYANWEDSKIEQYYGKDIALEIYEGMAKWVEIQYLIYTNEISYAKREEILTKLRDDEYGRGFLRYLQKYPLIYDHGRGRTPFGENPPL